MAFKSGKIPLVGQDRQALALQQGWQKKQRGIDLEYGPKPLRTKTIGPSAKMTQQLFRRRGLR